MSKSVGQGVGAGQASLASLPHHVTVSEVSRGERRQTVEETLPTWPCPGARVSAQDPGPLQEP